MTIMNKEYYAVNPPVINQEVRGFRGGILRGRHFDSCDTDRHKPDRTAKGAAAVNSLDLRTRTQYRNEQSL
jgi:hypothetical protein